MIVGCRVVHLSVTTSTMDEIDLLARQGEPEGVVVVADYQTTGRGRDGRSWHSSESKDLLCSILLRPSKQPSELGALPLVVGLAVAEIIEELAGLTCLLKWPNDVLIGGNKVAGVLLTSRLIGDSVDYVNVGMGINIGSAPNELPAGATSLSIEACKSLDREQVLSALLLKLDDYYAAFCNAGDTRFIRQWMSKAAFLHEHVTVVSGHDVVAGTMIGVDTDGALLVARNDGTTERVVAGDLVRGPRLQSAKNAKAAN